VTNDSDGAWRMSRFHTMPSPASSASSGRPWRSIAGVVLAIVAVTIGLVAVHEQRRARALLAVGQQAEKRYAALDARFPDVAPVHGQAPSRERLEAMLRARQALLDAMPPESGALARRALAGERLGSVELARRALDFAPALERASKAHADALEAARMSAAEYCRLLGVLVAEALAHPDRHPVAADYHRMAGALTVGDAARAAQAALDRTVRHAAPLAPEDAALADRLAEAGALSWALDLTALTLGKDGG
jgi:hypothetical protein